MLNDKLVEIAIFIRVAERGGCLTIAKQLNNDGESIPILVLVGAGIACLSEKTRGYI